MKFPFRILLLLPMSLLLLSTTCEKDEEPPQNNIRPGALKANFNGLAIDFAYLPQAGDLLADDNGLTGIIISGDTENYSKSFFIFLAPFTGTGQYILDGLHSEESSTSILYESSPPGGGIVTGYGLFDGLTGVLNITQFDGETIKGTFSGEIKCWDCNGNVELITITNGVIDMEYVGELY